MELVKTSTISGKGRPERNCDQPIPAFPKEALSKLGSKPVRTTIRVQVLASGQVEDVRIRESSGYKVLDDAAVTAAFKIKCTPFADSEKPDWLETVYEFKVQ